MSTTVADRRAVVQAFCDECVWLYCIRTHFRDLFEGNDKRRQLLAETASTLFHDLNLVLIDYLLLQQCKLTDPASSGKDKDNLTTNFIVELNWTASTAHRLRVANKKLLDFRALIVDARRKLVAHLDLKARLQPLDMGLFTPADEESFWLALQEFVDAAHEEAVDGPFDFKVAMQDGDVASLIHRLRDAIDYDDLINQEDGFLVSRYGKRRFDDA
jgi:hypothetical protein